MGITNSRMAINQWTLSFKERKKNALKKERIMNTVQLKHLFKNEAHKYYASKNRSFDVDFDNKNFLNIFCKYFAQDPSFENDHKGDLNKGLLVYGSNGTGKTSSFHIIQNISKKYGVKPLWFPIIETSKVVTQFNTQKDKDYVIQNYSKGRLLFDDLGAENEGSNMFIYGKEDIFIRIMEARYSQFISKKIITHITTNLKLIDIKKRYGPRVEDRFVEMFNFIELTGTSRRI